MVTAACRDAQAQADTMNKSTAWPQSALERFAVQ